MKSCIQFMAGYADNQLGAGEEEEEGVVSLDAKQSEYEQVMLQTAVEDFERNFQEEKLEE